MRKTIPFVLLTAVVAFGAITSAANAKPSFKLSGPMTQWSYLVGTWNCVTKVPAQGNMKAASMKATIQFSAQPQNSLGYYVGSTSYAGGGFIGWMDSKKLWWSTFADNFGGSGLETSASTDVSKVVFNGTTLAGGKPAPERETYFKISDTKYRDLYEEQHDGKWAWQADVTCAKTSNNSM